jgi:3-deoxy-D-manno-octulosonic-acid transferase
MNEKNRTLSKLFYNTIILPMATGGLYAASLFHEKIKRAIAGRRGLRKRMLEYAQSAASSPIWFHVSSVGEYEQAKPVISALNRDHPEIPVVVTFSSPSGVDYANQKETLDASNNIKYYDYLPLDFRHNAKFCLDSLKPRLLVFVKFDLWPNLIWEACDRNIPVILIAGTLSETSHRFTPIGRSLYRNVYDSIDRILAISEIDAMRFRNTSPTHRGIEAAGDTRFDRVADRKRAAENREVPLCKEGKIVLFGGSTWPKDEAHLLPAAGRLLREIDHLLFVIAPHEPSRSRVNELTAWAESEGVTIAPLSTLENTPNARVIIVDSVGQLAELYRAGDIAYVGGSFSTGVHNVMEPAIMGIPVFFGPVCDNSLEALELIDAAGAKKITNSNELYGILYDLIHNDDARRSMGETAQKYVESQLGATRRCVEVIEETLEHS